MFRKMRRFGQQLSHEACEEILQRATSGVLAVSGDDGYPYAVPLSYVYRDGRLYFHCAVEGHKLDAIRHSDKASFCVIDQDEVVPERYTTHYRSVIAFGRVRILEGDEKRRSIEWLADRYAPGETERGRQEAESAWNRLCMLEMRVEHMTGKQAIELVQKKG